MSKWPETNKTEFLRYLNVHENEVPELRSFATYYRRQNHTRRTFGMWLHARHISEFQNAYIAWWLRHPQLWGSIYAEAATAFPAR